MNSYHQPLQVREYDPSMRAMPAWMIQRDIYLMRLAYRHRDYMPLNRHRWHPVRWVSCGIILGAILAVITYL